MDERWPTERKSERRISPRVSPIPRSVPPERLAPVEITSRAMEKADFAAIVSVIDSWWGGPTTALAHPVFFHELGELARVAEADGKMVGFLFGFAAGETGYVHLVGIHPDYRRLGVGRVMYRKFEEDCVGRGCKRMKAINTLGNEGAVRFHEALRWKVETVEDYAGPNRTRLVFTKEL